MAFSVFSEVEEVQASTCLPTRPQLYWKVLWPPDTERVARMGGWGSITREQASRRTTGAWSQEEGQEEEEVEDISQAEE